MFCACALSVSVLSGLAAASPCGQAAPKTPAAAAAPEAPAAQQAERPQARRSYSYMQSGAVPSYAPSVRRGYRSPGMHGAGFKIRGRYNF